MSAKLIVTLILTGLVVVFIGQNAQVAELSFLICTLAVSQALLLFLVLAIGVIGGWVLARLVHLPARTGRVSWRGQGVTCAVE